MYGTYCRLGVSVWASDLAVIRAARLKIKPKPRRDRAKRDWRHSFFREMLEYHHRAQDLAAGFRL